MYNYENSIERLGSKHILNPIPGGVEVANFCPNCYRPFKMWSEALDPEELVEPVPFCEAQALGIAGSVAASANATTSTSEGEDEQSSPEQSTPNPRAK